MLAIQSACNEFKIRIPWERVAEIMGDDISDGACVQHLAKLRTTLIQMNVPGVEVLKRTGPKTLGGVIGEMHPSKRPRHC